MARGGGFTKRAAKRISRAVAAFERGDRDMGGVMLPRAGDDPDPIRLCKTTSAWAKNTKATLEIWEDGTPPSESKTTGETVEAVNKMHKVPSGSFVHVALGTNGTWYMIEAGSPDDEGSCKNPSIGGRDLTELTGYDATKKQALIHDAGCMKWLTIEECPTEPPA